MAAKLILVVDDEATVLESVQMTLTHLGYDVESAGGGPEALTKLDGHPKRDGHRFSLVLTDRRMPGMSGEQLALEIKRRYPTMPVILLTGFPPEGSPPGVDAILLKPFSVADLRRAVLELTGGCEEPPA